MKSHTHTSFLSPEFPPLISSPGSYYPHQSLIIYWPRFNYTLPDCLVLFSIPIHFFFTLSDYWLKILSVPLGFSCLPGWWPMLVFLDLIRRLSATAEFLLLCSEISESLQNCSILNVHKYRMPNFESALGTWKRFPPCDRRDLLGLQTDSMSEMRFGAGPASAL